MKPFIYIATAFFGISSMAIAQTNSDSTGLAGDHFSLQGALEMFKKSSSIEDFEKRLNKEDNNVNNLDLNGDGDIDYIRVNDKTEKDAHAIVLQVAISETELQDVAVIEVEKNGNASALLQIVGDDELYADNTIVEPFDEKEVKSGKGPEVRELYSKRMIINVWFWPCVQFIYAPAYVPWVSPWYWHHYPIWWKPWRPYPMYKHHKLCSHYHVYYHPVHVHRVVVAHAVYAPHHRSSVVVKNRYRSVHESRSVSKPGKTMKPASREKFKNKPNQIHQDKPHHNSGSLGGGKNKGGGKPQGSKGNKGGKGGRR